MSTGEEFQGFVSVSIFLPSQRVDGQVWKFANRRLLQQIEQDRREFVPVVDAKLYTTDGGSAQMSAEFDVLAVRKSAIIAIEPRDAVTPVSPR